MFAACSHSNCNGRRSACCEPLFRIGLQQPTHCGEDVELRQCSHVESQLKVLEEITPCDSSHVSTSARPLTQPRGTGEPQPPDTECCHQLLRSSFFIQCDDRLSKSRTPYMPVVAHLCLLIQPADPAETHSPRKSKTGTVCYLSAIGLL